jgi:hypothetical protein
MPGNLAGARDGDRAGEQQAPPISRVADALRNSRQERDRGGFKRVLKQDRAVEAQRAQLPDSGPEVDVRDQTVAEGFATI